MENSTYSKLVVYIKTKQRYGIITGSTRYKCWVTYRKNISLALNACFYRYNLVDLYFAESFYYPKRNEILSLQNELVIIKEID